jgi:hypothetical protein
MSLVRHPPGRPGTTGALRLALAALAVAVLLGVGLAFDPVGLRRAWMTALLVAAGPALGGLGLVLLGHLVGGAWFAWTRPRLQAMAWTIPFLALAALPLLGGFEHLYPPRQGAAVWTAATGIGARLVVLALFWTFLAWAASGPRNAAIGAIGLVLYVPTVSLGAVDWLMALLPGWRSSVVGLLFILQAWTAALACAVLAPGQEGSGQVDRRMLAGLLLTGLLAVAYLAFVQFLVVWSANLPAEVVWYARREGLLGAGGLVLVAFLAGLGAVALLLAAPRAALVPAALLALAGYGLHRVWEVAPGFAEPPPVLLQAAAVLALGLLWAALLPALTGTSPRAPATTAR